MTKQVSERVKAWGLKNTKTGQLINCATPDTYEIQTLYPNCMASGEYKLVEVLITEVK